jgi:hypothetical protein
MNSKPLPKIQSFLKELKRKNSAESNGKKQTFQEWSMAGGGVPTQYKGREHVWHAKVDKFAAGGEVKMGAGGFLKGVAGKAVDAAKATRKAPQEDALRLAQQRAALPPAKGGLGLPADNTPQQRAKAMGGKDKVHFSRHGGDYTTLDSGKFAVAPFDAVGTHVGTPEAAMERYQNTVGYKVNNPNYANDELKVATYPVTILGDRPMMNPKGLPFGEDELNAFLRQQGGHNWSDAQGGKMTYRDMNAKLRKKLFEEQGYTSIPYYNEVEGKGSVSYIVPPDNIRSRFAAFDPFRRDAATAAAMGVLAPDLMAEEKKKAKGGDVHMGAGGVMKGLIKGMQKVLPAAERDANKAKMLEGSKVKERLYHGTKTHDDYAEESGQAFGQFTSKPTWLAKEPYTASGYSAGTGSTYPVHAQVKNPLALRFDANDSAKKAFPIAKRFGVDIDHMVNTSKPERAWEVINNPAFIDAVEAAGHDGLMISEGGYKTYGVFDPRKIKSATGNRGTYDTSDPDISKARGGEVKMAGGGDPLDQFSPPRYRSAGRRPASQNDRQAAANMPMDFARGVVSGIGGTPGDIESLIRMLPGLDEKTVLPTSEDIEKRLPFKSDTPAGRAASGLGTLAGGFYMGPGAPIRLVGGIPQAVYKAGKDFGRAAGQPAVNVVKPSVPKGVEPIVVRTPEERAVMEKFGQKQEQEAARKKKVEKADKAAKENAGNAPEESGKPPKSTGKRVAVTPDYYRKMANDLGDEAVLRSARAGKHLKPTDAGYIGAPRTVTSPQGLGAMRKGMDTDFADAVEAVRLADPKRLGTWYDRAKQGIAESTEPYQLPRSLEQHAVYSAGVSPESELTFALKHLNSRVAGEPGMAYRGAGMRNLDEAVAESRPANLGFKIGEYGEKNDPRVPNTGLFGVNDFRRAQGMGYTDPQGNPWKAGVSDTMHPFMDAETALQVDRANTAGTGGRSDWQGPHIQEVPWVYGKGQDLHGRGLKGRYAGDELEGIKMALRDANNTARDYFYKHTGSATHEAIPGASTGHVPQMIDAPYEQKVAYGNIGRWDMPAPEYALSDMGTVGAGNRDAIYSALGYRQLPTLEASGAYFPEGAKIAEHQPVKIARPLLDFPTGGGGLVAEPTRHTMEFGERFRALNDAQEAFGFNLPNTMADVKGKNSLVLDTRGANPKYLDEPHTGVMPNETQMGALTQALGDVGYGVAPTSRGATVFPFDPKATAADARKLMKEKGSELQKIYPSEMEPSLNTSGYGPGVGVYTPEGFRASEPFSGQATMGLLKEASYLPPEVALNLGESENVRSAIRAKMNRDAALPNARADIQETRRFFSDADWPKAVELIRQGYTPAAALAALGYSASSMAEDRR